MFRLNWKSKTIFFIVIGALAAAIVIAEKGGAAGLRLSFLLATMYANGLFIVDPAGFVTGRRIRGALLLVVVIAMNAAIQLWVEGGLVLGVLVWLPAIAGVVAVKLLKSPG